MIMASLRQITCVYCVTFCEVMIQFWIILFLSVPRQDVSILNMVFPQKNSVSHMFDAGTQKCQSLKVSFIFLEKDFLSKMRNFKCVLH